MQPELNYLAQIPLSVLEALWDHGFDPDRLIQSKAGLVPCLADQTIAGLFTRFRDTCLLGMRWTGSWPSSFITAAGLPTCSLKENSA